MSFAGAAHITESLEIAANRKGDLTADVYERLFAQFPDTEALFVMDRGGQVRGAMLTHVFDTILEFIDKRRYAHRFIASEIITHEGYNVPPDAFAAFFGLVRDEVRAACDGEWSAAMEDAWRELLDQLAHYVVRRPEADGLTESS